ncbi:hypothetical protein WN943_002386 [Citrus x changshan-huyou]
MRYWTKEKRASNVRCDANTKRLLHWAVAEATVRGEERSDLFLDTTFVHGNNDDSNNIGKDGWKKPARQETRKARCSNSDGHVTAA